MQKVSLLVLLCFSFLLKGQEGDSLFFKKNTTKKRIPVLCEIKLQDGSSYRGFIEKQEDSLLFLKSSLGVTLQIPKKQVLRIDFVHGSVKDTLGTTLLQIPQISNNYYIVSSNAFLQKRGEFYGSSSYFVFYNLNYAIDKHVSVGISTSFYAVPVMLHIKSNFKIGNNMYLGLDGMGGSGSWLNPKSYGGLGLAKLTYGTIHTNFTISAGYGNIEYYSRASRRRGGGFGSYRPSKHRDYNSFLVAAAFTCPISTRFAFTAEAFAAPLSGIYTLAPALRTTRKPNLSFVFGIEGILTISPTSGLAKVIGFPYLGASFRIK